MERLRVCFGGREMALIFRMWFAGQSSRGLEVLQLQAMNLALLRKWVDRFMSLEVDQATQVLKENYGPWMDWERHAVTVRGESVFW